ncbi:MAG: hypothetical protein IJQ82_03660 [Selenomonadaceae bacterium]|nr:hypothetical protein [Selenomonadaceae bacterium]
MFRRRFANGEISWMFDQMSRDYPDSPSKVWRQRTNSEELPEIRAEEEKYRARIQNGLDLMAEYLMDLWGRGK